jgi:hypothetical protein
MILKEKNFKQFDNPKLKAGDAAEKQMAFYLQRQFGNLEDCYVINDLRLTHKKDVAQIDHLIVTKYGLFIIESKSAHGKISINKQLEWSRTYSGKTEGMRSPVLQAKAQVDLLKQLLIDNKEDLREKILFGIKQPGFKYCPFNIYVAISDNGIIDRKIDVPELYKADQIVEKISKKLDELKKNNSLLSTSLELWAMNSQETVNVANFLKNQHQPLINDKSESPKHAEQFPDNVAMQKAGDICPTCKTGKLVKRKAKTEFLGCSNYPKCEFTDYK